MVSTNSSCELRWARLSDAKMRHTQRAPRSCKECSSRKIKCDKGIPCKPCTKRGQAARCTREVVL